MAQYFEGLADLAIALRKIERLEAADGERVAEIRSLGQEVVALRSELSSLRLMVRGLQEAVRELGGGVPAASVQAVDDTDELDTNRMQREDLQPPPPTEMGEERAVAAELELDETGVHIEGIRRRSRRRAGQPKVAEHQDKPPDASSPSRTAPTQRDGPTSVSIDPPPFVQANTDADDEGPGTSE